MSAPAEAAERRRTDAATAPQRRRNDAATTPQRRWRRLGRLWRLLGRGGGCCFGGGGEGAAEDEEREVEGAVVGDDGIVDAAKPAAILPS